MTMLEKLEALAAAVAALINEVRGSAPAGPTPVAPPGYVAMPVTGHVLPLPSAADVSLWGYMLRCYAELGLSTPAPKRLADAASTWAGETANQQRRDLWPEAADRAANATAYMSPSELAAYRAAEAAAASAPFVSTPRPRPVGPALPPVGSE